MQELSLRVLVSEDLVERAPYSYYQTVGSLSAQVCNPAGNSRFNTEMTYYNRN